VINWDSVISLSKRQEISLSHAKVEKIARLSKIDSDSVRALRAKAAGTATAEDEAKLLALDSEAAVLRLELAGLAP
jgi:hypothetical protein